MSKRKVETLVDSFVDEKGQTRNFVIAAISIPFDNFNDAYVVLEGSPFENGYTIDLTKGLKIGWAICNPTDIFSEELGKQIAIGRAEKNSEYALFVSQPGYINTTMVQAFLKQEAEYFKTNPESKIKGYKRMK